MNLPTPAFPDLIVPTQAPHTTLVLSGVLQQKVAELTQQMTALPAISDNATFQEVRNLVKAASKLKRDVEASRLVANSPFNNVVAAINAAAKGVMGQLDAIVNEGKAQETHFLIEQDRLRYEEAERLRQHEALARADTSRPTAPLPVAQLSQVIDAPIGTRTELEITDMTLIPDEFWVLDMAKLRTAVLTEKRTVPGVTTKVTSQVVAR